MILDAIELDETQPVMRVLPPLSAQERDAVLLSLTGGSVIDWTGLAFKDQDEVGAFFRLWLADTSRDAWARERVRYVYNQAVEYLEEHLGLTFPAEVRRPKDVRDAFTRASVRVGFNRNRVLYCAILKIVHVINHLEMQELRNLCAIREVDLIALANERVQRAAMTMREEGFPLRAFYGNRKTRPSVMTKLLAKREATAATIFDKLRFRLVTEHRDDLVPALGWLMRHLVPFAAIIPGESHNNLLSDAEVEAALRDAPELGRVLQPGAVQVNPDSGDVYRVINFICDLPVRVYDLPGVAPPANRAMLGEAVPVLVEFQVVDSDTDVRNEAGQSRHTLYKARQMSRVYERLGKSAGGKGR